MLLAPLGCVTPAKLDLAAREPAATAAAPEPGGLPPKQAASLCLAMAKKLEDSNDVNGAIDQYERVLQNDPDNHQVERRLAVLYDRKLPPDFAKADLCYRKLVKLYPRDADLYNDWGYSYYLRHDKPDEAEKQLRKAIELDPKNQRARSNLGLVLGQKERYPEALQAFRDAGASEADAHCNLAFVYWTKGKLDEARRECQTAQQLNPACPKAGDMLAKLTAPPKGDRADEPARPRSPSPRAAGPRPPAESRPGPVAAGTPEPVYTSPNGTVWAPVSPRKAANASAESNGVAGTMTLE
jgi:Flp pilus assembly protein TadD